MILFCSHYWNEVSRTYQKPVAFEGEGLSSYLAEKLLFGVTTVETRCGKCGEIKFVTAVGNAKGEVTR